ncbi:MAG TPA: hypothetical protein VFQ45_18620 [Longimicrobium sp.]|nr:hypothetical protein [Longimicrobium sp.]
MPRPAVRRLPQAAALAAAALACVPVAAQDAPRCPGGVISEIFIDNQSVFEVGSPELDPRFNWAYRAANSMHLRTRPEVIRRELLFHEGSCYSAALLEDSERILRSSPFIADADVFAVAQPDGSYHVVVETRDEWSMRLEPQVESGRQFQLTGVELREDNLLGLGHQVSAYVKEYQGERIYGAAYGTRQLFGTHLDAELSVARTPVGYGVVQRLSYPFRGEAGRWAFRQQVERLERNFEYFVPTEDGGIERRFFPEDRRSFDVGGVFRLGRRGNLTLFGVSLSGEWVEYPRSTLTPRGDGGSADVAAEEQELVPSPELTGLDTISSVRLVFLAGQRNVWFSRRRALDAVRGTEDVRLGVEVELGLGRSLAAFSDDDDLSVDVGFAAAGDLPGGILAGFRAEVEGRRDFGARTGSFEWRNLFGQLDGWAYWRPSEESRHTFVAAVSGAGGWHTTVPFQLTLGSRSGMRGFPTHAYPGERRVVASLEHRRYLGWPYPRLFDMGTAAFVDVGKSWAGGDAFGMNSPVEVDVGVGLRTAFPPGSRRTYRLDVAMPVTEDFSFSNLVVSFGIGQAVGRRTATEDPQIRRSSRRLLSASLFSFPN